MSDNVSHWLPLKMRTRPLRMRRITWPMSRGSKTITFLESPTPISLCNFYWAPTTIKGRLLSSRPMLKPFSGEKNSTSRRNGAQKWRFLENGGRNLRFWFRDPKRHFLARNRVVWRILPFSRTKKVAESLFAEGREITHAQNRNP